jgi:23S rRNA (pseudouridine1915-N3)-methyltransferase
MRIRIFSIGRVKQDFVLSGENEYLKRLKKHVRIELTELDESNSGPPDAARQKEAEQVLARLKKGEFLIVLDEAGQAMSSHNLSELIEKRQLSGSPDIAFAIGGAYGWHHTIRDRADLVLSLSKMTFTYQMTRLILVEQIYRALSILRGEPYHK